MVKPKKQLIKLKAGRTLPKGNNLTDTSFKSRKIQIRGQTKQYVGNPEDRQKFEFVEWSKSLNSNNTQVKKRTLSKIFQFVSLTKFDVVPEFNDIFNSVLKLAVDTDPEIRKQAHVTLKKILSRFSQAKVFPSFQNLKLCISCATTHMDFNIRKDSLVLLEMGLKYFPDIMCKLHSLLDKILGLISHKVMKRKRGDNTFIIALTIPSENEDCVMWRNSVLQYISKFLQYNVSALKAKRLENLSEVPSALVGKCAVVYCRSSCSYSSFHDDEAWSSDLDNTDFNSDTKAFELFIDKLMQVLLAIWIEVGSSDLSQLTDHTDEHTVAMDVVLKIICLLVEWIDCRDNSAYLKDRVCLTYNKIISEKIFSKFPLYENSEIGVSGLNNKMCQIYTDLLIKGPPLSNLGRNVSDYLLEKVEQDLDVEEMKHIISLLKNFLKCDDVAPLYEQHLGLLYSHIDCSEREGVKEMLYRFFFDLTLILPCYQSLPDNGTVAAFLSLLPSKFIDTAKMGRKEDAPFFQSILKVPSCWNSTFQEGITKKFCDITFLMISSCPLVSYTAISLIMRLQSISREQFTNIAAVIQNNVPSEVIKELLGSLVRKANSVDPGFHMHNLFCFLLNLVFGPNAMVEYPADVKEQAEEEALKSDLIPFKLSSYTIVNDFIPQSQTMRDMVIHYLKHLLNQELVYAFIQNYLSFFLKKSCSTVSFSVAISILKFANFNRPVIAMKPGKAFAYDIADLNVGCFLYLISLDYASVDGIDCNDTAREDLIASTFDICHIFKVLGDNALAIKGSGCLTAVEQLLIHVLSAPIGSLDIASYKAIYIFFAYLTSHYNDYFQEREWWSSMFSHVKKACHL